MAQEKIETDRPGETQSPILVPRGWFQAELGLEKENNTDDDYTLEHPTALLRYGVSKKFELRLESNVQTEYQQLIPNPKETTGLSPVEVGAKLFLAEEKGARPKTSLITQVGLPFLSSRPFRTPHLSPAFRLAMQNSITEAFDLDYNIGAEWDGISTQPSWLYTIAPGFSLGDRWFAYVEAFGYLAKEAQPQHNLDAGFAYSLSDNSRIDLSGGVGLSPESFRNYIAVGFSFRVPVLKRMVSRQ